MSGTTDGSNGKGSVADGEIQSDYLLVDGNVYVRGNEVFWTQGGAPAAEAKKIAASQKWVKVPASEAKSLTDNSTFAVVVKEIFSQGGSPNAVTTRVETESVNGVECYVLSDRFGPYADAKIYVAKDSMLPVRLAAGSDGSLDFDQWNSAPPVTAPPAAELYR